MITLVEPLNIGYLVERPDLGCATLLAVCREAGRATRLVIGQSAYLDAVLSTFAGDAWDLLSVMSDDELGAVGFSPAVRERGSDAFAASLLELLARVKARRTARDHLDLRAVHELRAVLLAVMRLHADACRRHEDRRLRFVDWYASRILAGDPSGGRVRRQRRARSAHPGRGRGGPGRRRPGLRRRGLDARMGRRQGRGHGLAGSLRGHRGRTGRGSHPAPGRRARFGSDRLGHPQRLRGPGREARTRTSCDRSAISSGSRSPTSATTTSTPSSPLSASFPFGRAPAARGGAVRSAPIRSTASVRASRRARRPRWRRWRH